MGREFAEEIAESRRLFRDAFAAADFLAAVDVDQMAADATGLRTYAKVIGHAGGVPLIMIADRLDRRAVADGRRRETRRRPPRDSPLASARQFGRASGVKLR